MYVRERRDSKLLEHTQLSTCVVFFMAGTVLKSCF